MSERDLDETDRRIVHCLQGDARNVTTAEIGAELDVSGSTVANRITQLEDAGIIAGYVPVVDYERSGYDQHHLFVCTVDADREEGIVDAVAAEEGVVDVTRLLADEENLLVEVVAEDAAAVEGIADALSDLGVTVARTAVVTNAVARAGPGFGKRNDSDE